MTETEQVIDSSTRDVRRWAMFCHLGAFLCFLATLFLGSVAPLVIWLTKKDDAQFIDEHGKESVNFQITMLIALIGGGFLTLFVIGILLWIPALILLFVMPIVAAIKASNGEHYRYPLTIRFIK